MEAQEEAFGPVDIVVIAYPADAPMTGEAVPIVLDLVERGIIRVLDVLFVMQNDDGTFSGFEGASTGLLGDDDVATASDALEPGSAAVMIVYENRWAAPFVAAVRRNGGFVVDNQRIPAEDLMAALEAAE